MSAGTTQTAVAAEPAGLPVPPPTARAVRSRGGWGRRVVLAVAAVYFLGPLLAAVWFTVRGPSGGVSLSAYGQIFQRPPNSQIGLGGALVYSLEIAVVTIVIALGLMLPTQLLLRLRLTSWRGLVEVVSLLPLVFPPVVFVVGVSAVYAAAAPATGTTAGQGETGVFRVLRFLAAPDHPVLLALLYVVLVLPFVYRALDTGLHAIDAPTLVEAARNLGAGWVAVIVQVLLPCLRTAVVNAAFLCFALVMGEYTIASILLYTKPFPVWLAQLPTQSGQVQAAVSVFSLLLVELILLLVGTLNWRSTRHARDKRA